MVKFTFKSATLYPEGIAYHAKRDVFFLISLRHVKTGAVDLKGNSPLNHFSL